MDHPEGILCDFKDSRIGYACSQSNQQILTLLEFVGMSKIKRFRRIVVDQVWLVDAGQSCRPNDLETCFVSKVVWDGYRYS